MSYERRKTYFENLKILVKSEYEEVFRILKKHKVEYTENSNGIFFDVSLLSETAFEQLEEYMKFCLSNRRAEENRSKELATLSAETNKFLLEGYSSN
uniref:NET domain-containing protein n=1 Tax=viral metagenome TaxID=1070528 RepID=A0A6C0AP43_9ZZZZ